MLRTDSRRNPRIEVERPLSAHVEVSDPSGKSTISVRVLNVSFGGFLIDSVVPFALGAELEFNFPIGEWRSLSMTARAIYRVDRPDTIEPTYSCGFAFVNAKDPITLWRIRELMRHVTAMMIECDELENQPVQHLTGA